MLKNKLWWVVFTIGAVLTMYNAVAAEWNDKPVICEQREVFENVIKTRGEIPVSIGQILAKVRDPDGSNGLSDIPAVLPITLYINPKTKTFTITEYHATYNSVCVLAFGENWSGIGKSM